jgi:hypothetical protein
LYSCCPQNGDHLSRSENIKKDERAKSLVVGGLNSKPEFLPLSGQKFHHAANSWERGIWAKSLYCFDGACCSKAPGNWFRDLSPPTHPLSRKFPGARILGVSFLELSDLGKALNSTPLFGCFSLHSLSIRVKKYLKKAK